MPAPARRRWLRWLGLAALAWTLFVAALAIFQERLLYLPRSYPEGIGAWRDGRLRRIAYDTGEGRQQAWYLAPPDGGQPRSLWLCCGGNAALGLDWLLLVEGMRDPGVGFLLVDYPGYGGNPGAPAPASIDASLAAAVPALAGELGLAPGDLAERVSALGHSLGCAAALGYAAGHPVRRVVLVAPFTSMLDMARGVVGWPFNHVLRHRFDNRAALARLAARSPPPAVAILHGEDDRTIPPWMGRALADAHPGMIAFTPIPGAGHNDILIIAADDIRAAMR